MKTRCPSCETIFRVTPEQLKARAGKVRCGQCQGVFNALDSLVEVATSTRAEAVPAPLPEPPPPKPEADLAPETELAAAPEQIPEHEAEPEPAAAPEPAPPLNEAQTREAAKAAGLIMPRETTEIPGYNRWAESALAMPMQAAKRPAWPFALAGAALVCTLVTQLAFHFRSELSITTPSLRPALEALADALGEDIPLPRHVDLVSIEASDLQADPAHGNLLALQATLKNRAPYAQALPLLEISLTDTQDTPVLRRVLQAGDYLPPKADPSAPFPANGEIAVHLWLEAKDVNAAGYRLYVFYP